MKNMYSFSLVHLLFCPFKWRYQSSVLNYIEYDLMFWKICNVPNIFGNFWKGSVSCAVV
uniref:Uncharacterized protein n=1 Tax=Anguilla anguilla TaxID=7936 RepID=A0A0E9X958_ANGAN